MNGSPEQLSLAIEVIFGLIVIPWCVWVTASIFGLKTQSALLKAELESVQRIEGAVKALADAILMKK